MIELLPGMPAGTVDFRKALQSGAPLRTLYVIDDLGDIEAGALWEDMKTTFDVGLRHHDRWERSAIVTDIDWMARATKLFAWMIPGEARVFGLEELDEAKRWIAGQSGP